MQIISKEYQKKNKHQVKREDKNKPYESIIGSQIRSTAEGLIRKNLQ